MTRFHKLPANAVFRHYGVIMLKKSAFRATTYSHILGKDRIISVFIWPFSKVELVKK